jgi:hypothetical protein
LVARKMSTWQIIKDSLALVLLFAVAYGLLVVFA